MMARAHREEKEWKGDFEEIGSHGATCKLPKEVTVILPDTCEGCRPIVMNLIDMMSASFGGTTVTHADGCWMNDRGIRVCEPVVKIESSHSCLNKEEERYFIKRVTDAAKRMDQEMLMVKTDRALLIDMREYHGPE
jgi:hypothetical protein